MESEDATHTSEGGGGGWVGSGQRWFLQQSIANLSHGVSSTVHTYISYICIDRQVLFPSPIHEAICS